MIRQRLELILGKLSDSLFTEVMQATTSDIMINQVMYKQRTSFDAMINRAVIACHVFVRMDRCPRCATKDEHAMANYCFHCGIKLR